MPGFRERRWLRPLGLFGLAVALAVGQPSLVGLVAFGLLVLFAPGTGFFPILAAAVAFGLAFVGEAGGALWYLDRGWAIMVGGWFATVVGLWPTWTFFPLALVAVGCALVSMWVLLSAMGGVETAEQFVAERIRSDMQYTLEMFGNVPEGQGFFGEAVRVTAESQMTFLPALAEARIAVLPALMGLSALASLGVAWWMHQRLVKGTGDGLGAIRDFRFPDPLIWVMIVGIVLMLTGEWGEGAGRVGTNMVAFMGGLYSLRGAGVLLALVGSLSFWGGLAITAGALFVGPYLLAAAMVVGLSDSWFDLRARTGGREDGGAG